jgi:hypothetical protein
MAFTLEIDNSIIKDIQKIYSRFWRPKKKLQFDVKKIHIQMKDYNSKRNKTIQCEKVNKSIEKPCIKSINILVLNGEWP